MPCHGSSINLALSAQEGLPSNRNYPQHSLGPPCGATSSGGSLQSLLHQPGPRPGPGCTWCVSQGPAREGRERRVWRSGGVACPSPAQARVYTTSRLPDPAVHRAGLGEESGDQDSRLCMGGIP